MKRSSPFTVVSIATVAAIVAVAAGSHPGPASAQAPRTYEVVDLGSLGPGYDSTALKVDDRGRVAGELGNVIGPNSCAPPLCPLPRGNPAIFSKGRTPLVLNDLEAQPTGINAAREVIGFAYTGSPSITSFHWKNGVNTLIPNVQLLAINDASVAVGIDYSRGAAGAVKYENGAVAGVGNWGIETASSAATAISNNGTIFGYRTLYFDPYLKEGIRINLDGSVQRLSPPLPPVPTTFPFGANANGDVVGTLLPLQSPWLGWAIIGGRYHRIEVPGAMLTAATAINDFGRVVGYSSTSSPTEGRAFLWERGTMTDLSLLPEVVAAGWTVLTIANDINNRGVIVGNGVRGDSGDTHGYMLIPQRR
jgi:probable HAF family extracellular repeat protein